MIADILHRRGVVDGEGFSLSAARKLERLPRWSKSEVVKALNSIPTTIFRRHPEPPKKVLLEEIGAILVERWPSTPFHSFASQMQKIKILFLSANPLDVVGTHPVTKKLLVSMPLRLDDEVREIQKRIRASEHWDALELVVRPAARPDDLLQSLHEVKPQVVHISGHGSDLDELYLLDSHGKAKAVSKSAIAALFKTMRGDIRVVVLNACYSRPQATAITKHVDCAIGMSRAIGDEAAIVFAAAFYRGIAFGKSVKQSFDEGIVALQVEGIKEHSTPKLMSRNGINPDRVLLIE
jgi:hypothetical protein